MPEKKPEFTQICVSLIEQFVFGQFNKSDCRIRILLGKESSLNVYTCRGPLFDFRICLTSFDLAEARCKNNYQFGLTLVEILPAKVGIPKESWPS